MTPPTRPPHTRSIVVVLALVLALEAADRGAVGALAPSLERAFHIGHAQLGWLAGSVTIVATAATVPVGIAIDRMQRVAFLAVMVLTWALGMAVAGIATTFAALLGARLFLGGVTAVAYPAVASLTGDLFPRANRGAVLGRIRTGEMVGAGGGLVVAGALVALWSWRAMFFLLALLGIGLALVVRRVREPPRGDAGDAERMSLGAVTRYVFSIRTNVLLMLAGSVGDFFFAGLQIFLVSFVIHQYGVPQYTAVLLVPVVGIGAVAGLVFGGRWGDRLMEQGRPGGRVALAAVAFLAVGPLVVPLLFLHSILLALPFMVVDGALLTVPVPTLDAARLDVVHPRLWGRAEAVRTAVRTVAQSAGPVLFGVMADHLAGGGPAGLRLTFLVMVPTLVLNGLVLLVAARTYPADAARAEATARGDLPLLPQACPDPTPSPSGRRSVSDARPTR